MTDSIWSASAETRHHWAAVRDEQLGPPTTRMLDILEIKPGQTVLDLATGTGQSAILAAQRVGASGLVYATDVAEGMVEVAARAANEAGLTNIVAKLMDAEHLDLPDTSVDVVLSRLGLLHFANPGAALVEMLRVLRPGGMMGAMVWAVREKNPYLAVPALALRGRIAPRKPDLPPPNRPPRLRTDDPVALQQAVEGAGFQDVSVEPVESWIRLPTLEEATRFVEDMQAPIHPLIAAMTVEQQTGFRADMQAGFAPFQTDAGFAMPGELLIVTGRKP